MYLHIYYRTKHITHSCLNRTRSPQAKPLWGHIRPPGGTLPFPSHHGINATLLQEPISMHYRSPANLQKMQYLTHCSGTITAEVVDISFAL